MKKILKWGGITIIALLTVTVIALYVAVTYRWKGEFFDANGVDIHFTDEGNHDGVPVILVHGYAANADLNWRYPGIIRTLKKQDYRVIAMDMRGHGLSGKPHDELKYGMEMVEDIVRLMDHLELPKAHVVGYSMGGLITMKLVAAHPDRLLSAAVGGAGWFDLESPKVQLLKNLGAALDEGQGYAPLINGLHPESRFPGLDARIATWAINFVNDPDALRALLPGMMEWLVPEEAMRANKVPLLVICGTNDPMKEGAQNLEGLSENTTVVYVDHGDHESTVFKRLFRDSVTSHLAANTATESEAQGAAMVEATAR